MSQNARLDPSLITKARRMPAMMETAPKAASSTLLGRIGVGQKLAITAGLFALPITVLLYLTVSGHQQDIRSIERKLAGTSLIDPYVQVQNSMSEYVRAQTRGYGSTAKVAAEKVDQTLLALQNAMAAQGLSASQAATERLTREWKVLQQSRSDQGGLFRTITYQQFNLEQMLPTLDAVLEESTLALDPSEVSNYATQTALITLPRVLARLSSLAALAQSLELVKNQPALVDVLAPLYRNEANRAGVALDDAFVAVRRAEALNASLVLTLGDATRNLENMRQIISTAASVDLSNAVEGRANLTALDSAVAQVAKAVKSGNQEVTRLLANRASLERRALIQELLAVGLITLLAGLLLLAVARAITGPLRRLADSARALEGGDLGVSVPVNTRDELGVVGQAFNAATAKLRVNQEKTETERQDAQRLQANVAEFLDVTMKIADGDLTQRGRVSEDVLGNVVDSINLMTEELASVLGDVQRASTSVTGGSQAMLDSTEQIRAGTLITTEETGRVTQQANDMTVAIRQMSAIAQASADSAQRALSASQTGQQAVISTLQGMEAIRESSQDVSVRVQSLSQRSKQIEEIVDSIGHIASQVNLLSLHASIEAAGAGEGGKRFAVVAEEIRELADLSTVAAARMASLIAEVQSDVRGVAQNMQVNSEQVEQGYTVAGQAGEALREMADLAGVTAHFASNISDAARDQLRDVQGMSSAVTQIADVARASQRSAETGREVAEQLQELAQRLSGSLTRFRLPG
ncbi:methyl-accepting chemotaxis protein [Deinococcus sp. AJ005]|uniref:methyl-accepting chemotaxis protein n=1 Tax=Deinococcus sp. AJ005 TaxID=2652443 RepID=UPI00125CBF5F|nr:methyl-accepting chemotaxis protein [Deinococcus sp. AJ005]QFP75165.1 methyl-accepting chemotaxis protein [Deinococcus sp. AJ005]